MTLQDQVQGRLAALIAKGQAVLETDRPPPRGVISLSTYVDGQLFSEWQAQSVVCLAQVFGEQHGYTPRFEESTKGGALGSSARHGLGILRAALEDVEQGHLATIQQLAAGDIFSDFLEQADHLLSNGYSAPAASLAGAVLENGLRSIAQRNNITIKSRDNLSALNQRLAEAGVHNRLRQKQIAVWIDVRNAADHGHFDDLREPDVAELIRGVRDLLAEQM